MSFFLRHFAGFLIQIGAGMLLCLLPFSEESFRYPRKCVITGYSILSLLFSALFPAVMSVPFFQEVHYRSMIANIYMLSVLVLFICLYFWVIRAETIKKVMVLLLTVFYAATQYLLVNLVTPLFPGGVLPDVYPPLTLAVYVVTMLLLFPPLTFLMKRGVREYLMEMEPQNIRREFGSLILATTLYLILLVIYASRPDGPMEELWWWIIPPLLLAITILSVFYWNIFRESVRRKRDSEERKAMEIQQFQYESITRDMELTRRMHHDMHHVLNHLAGLLDKGNTEEMREYLSDLTVQVDHRDAVNYCKNKTVNGLLQFYLSIAADKRIRCEVMADCDELTISPVDLTILIGNSMENAIRACEQFADNRWISINMGVIGDSLVIQVENPCKNIHPSGKYRLEGNFLPAAAFVSSRAGGGYGLSSLEHTARKYDGNASFRFEHRTRTFTTRIRVNLHPEMLK